MNFGTDTILLGLFFIATEIIYPILKIAIAVYLIDILMKLPALIVTAKEFLEESLTLMKTANKCSDEVERIVEEISPKNMISNLPIERIISSFTNKNK